MKEDNTDETLKQVQLFFKLAMGNTVEVGIDTEKKMISEWDSINHLNLIVEMESALDLGLSMEEIEKLSSVRQIVELIKSRKS